MDKQDYWRLCDYLNIMQAALLICGQEPSGELSNVERLGIESQPDGYDATKSAISNALKNGLIEGQLIPRYEHALDGERGVEIKNSVDLTSSTIEVESLRVWLRGRGFTTGFFFPTATGDPDYLDPNHPRYAPKLAAAVNAWLATEDESTTMRSSPKKALMKWLREHASEYFLSDSDGKPNEQGIEETAKVANWQPGGGAPKTPGG